MKTAYQYLSGLILILFMVACGNQGDDSVRDEARQSLGNPTPDAASLPGTATPPPAAPLSASGNVQHYYCSNNCEGSGGNEAGTCPVCGSEYVHNAAFHNNTTTPPNPTSATSTTIPPPGGDSPAQNASGVWHYTCPSGCAGGGGAAGSCGTCGAELAHNAAYHN